MKFFLDTANVGDIKYWSDMGLVDGVTTNPSLVAKEKRPFKTLVREICSIVDGPVSVEATSLETDGILKEAREFSKWSDNIVIKVPFIKEGVKALPILRDEDIMTNTTLIFSANQALIAMKAGTNFVSPFIGRLDDIAHYGMDIVSDIMAIKENYLFSTEVIVASIRHPIHVVEAAKIGAEISTIPAAVLEKMFKHPLTDKGLDSFLKDWKSVEV
ncbi:MAG TPA: fructose-6-phosphate aldolase [Candidatus Methanofastidiosa archaeon]|nr:fructose-6-phosphate aldolase [Candidatus Methanofastidiosa archaeon]